jgi:hypothetical protein
MKINSNFRVTLFGEKKTAEFYLQVRIVLVSKVTEIVAMRRAILNIKEVCLHTLVWT